MREIKFRAWDKEEEKMVPAIHIFINGTGVVWENQREGFEGTDDLNSTNKWEIMQFTGLEDVLGNDLYEGDICRDEDGLGVIYWDKDCWMYGFVLFDSSYKSDGYMLREMADDCEVIGNIYENPELLEVAP